MSWKSSPKLRPTPWDGLVVLLVAALAVGLAFFQWRGGQSAGALEAVVTIDGEEADRFAPAELIKAPRIYEANGYTLTVVLAIDYEHPHLNALPPSGEAGIRVSVSDCPTQDCVRTGMISRSGQSIVCLPGRFILRLEGGETESGGVDAVLG